MRPHRQQPTRLLHPWDSPGKKTGVGCHVLLQPINACWVASVVSKSVWTAAHQAPLSTGFSRQEYWSGWPFLLQTNERRYSNISKAWLLLLKMQNISVEQSFHSSLSEDKDLEHQTLKSEVLSLEKTHPEGLSSTFLERFLLGFANWALCYQTPGNTLEFTWHT